MDNTMVKDAAWVAGNQCAVCKTPIDKDEYMCPQCMLQDRMDDERSTYMKVER